MPRLGSFGPLVFEVSDERVRTPARFERRLSARLVEHEVVGGKARLERTGYTLSDVTLRMKFTVEMGLDPAEELSRLEALLFEGSAHPLLLGKWNLGRFTLAEIREVITRTDGKGRILATEVEVKLKEYI